MTPQEQERGYREPLGLHRTLHLGRKVAGDKLDHKGILGSFSLVPWASLRPPGRNQNLPGVEDLCAVCAQSGAKRQEEVDGRWGLLEAIWVSMPWPLPSPLHQGEGQTDLSARGEVEAAGRGCTLTLNMEVWSMPKPQTDTRTHTHTLSLFPHPAMRPHPAVGLQPFIHTRTQKNTSPADTEWWGDVVEEGHSRLGHCPDQ